jgi:response regulator RpfG family c-di-GMP phosphodiesterase
MERTLLLVDDEENILKSLQRLLRRDNYQIFIASSGQMGLELLKEHQINVIISDQRMPHMSGSEFLSQVKSVYPNTVRIMLSGYTDLDSVTEAINQGAIFRFLTKPWDDELLRNNIKEAFDYLEIKNDRECLLNELREARPK